MGVNNPDHVLYGSNGKWYSTSQHREPPFSSLPSRCHTLIYCLLSDRMHAFHFAVSTAAVAAFGAIVAGQAYPEMTAPAILPISDNQTWMYTTPLNPEDPDYIDDAIAARLAKRSPPAGVYLCDSTNWAGKCKWTPVTPYTCYGYPNSPASSVGVSSDLFAVLVSCSKIRSLTPCSSQPPQGWQCKVFYGKTGCVPGTGTDGKLTYPGAGNLGALYPKADPPKSYLCRPCIDADPHSPW